MNDYYNILEFFIENGISLNNSQIQSLKEINYKTLISGNPALNKIKDIYNGETVPVRSNTIDIANRAESLLQKYDLNKYFTFNGQSFSFHQREFLKDNENELKDKSDEEKELFVVKFINEKLHKFVGHFNASVKKFHGGRWVVDYSMDENGNPKINIHKYRRQSTNEAFILNEVYIRDEDCKNITNYLNNNYFKNISSTLKSITKISNQYINFKIYNFKFKYRTLYGLYLEYFPYIHIGVNTEKFSKDNIKAYLDNLEAVYKEAINKLKEAENKKLIDTKLFTISTNFYSTGYSPDINSIEELKQVQNKLLSQNKDSTPYIIISIYPKSSFEKKLIKQKDNLNVIVDSKDKSQIIANNKKIMSNIAKKLSPIASRIAKKIQEENNIPYLVDFNYKIPTYNEAYSSSSDSEFGIFTLLTINTNKAYKLYDDNYASTKISIKEWEKYCFKLCSELNKDSNISHYGEAFTEQPDDGDQINFRISEDFLTE